MSISLKQLSVQEKIVLYQLIGEVKNKKEAKEKELKQRQKSKTSKKSITQSKKVQQQINQSKPILRACQANEYIKMVYLMLREGVYGTIKQKGLSFNIIEQHLSFYKDTYIFKHQLEDPSSSSVSSLSSCKSKLLIFESISQNELRQYYFNKHVIRKLQRLAEIIHEMIETYIRKYCCVKNKSDSKSVQNKTVNKLQLKQHQKNIIQPLQEIIDIIEQHYLWQRWTYQKKQQKNKITNGLQINQSVQIINKPIRLEELNFKAVNLLAGIQQNVNRLSECSIFGKTVNKVVKEMHDKKYQRVKQIKQMRDNGLRKSGEKQKENKEKEYQEDKQQQSTVNNKNQHNNKYKHQQKQSRMTKCRLQQKLIIQQQQKQQLQQQQQQYCKSTTNKSTTNKTTTNKTTTNKTTTSTTIKPISQTTSAGDNNISTNTNYQLTNFCQQLRTIQQDKSSILKLYYQEKLKQQLLQFRYYQLEQLNNQVSTEMKSQQLKGYHMKKQLGSLLLKHFYNIYGKYNNNRQQQQQQQLNHTLQA